MNVFHNDYNFIRHPLKWLRRFFLSLKYMWQRAKNGFCDVDLCDLEYHYAHIFSRMLKELADNSYGYPTTVETHDAWKKILNDMSYHFKMTLEDSYETPCLDAWFNETCDDCNLNWLYQEYTDEQKVLREKMHEENKHIWNERVKHKDEALKMLSEYWFDLWD